MIYNFPGDLVRFLIYLNPLPATQEQSEQVLVYAQDLTKVKKKIEINDLECILLEYIFQ